jgi:hypothetical protein
LSANASDIDKELAYKIILTYCKTSPQNSYTLSCDEVEIINSPFASRNEIQPFTL